MKVDLKNSLLTREKNALKDAESEVRLILAAGQQEDLDILRGLGNNHTHVQAEDRRGEFLEIQEIKKGYGEDIVTIGRIKSLCIDYNLRFLSSRHFIGAFDAGVLTSLKKFAKEANMELDSHTLGSKFFIIAPEECFNLSSVRVKFNLNKDPVLLYKVDETHYRIIHKWGKDFTILRLIQGFKYKNASSRRLYYAITIFPVISVLIAIITDVSTILGNPVLFTILISLLSYGVALFLNMEGAFEPFKFESTTFGEGKWRSTTKIEKVIPW